MSVSIQLTKKSQQLLNRLAKSGKIDFRPTFKVIGIGYQKEVKAIFEKQQPRAVGLRWAPLSATYAAWKEIHYPGAPILVRTGKLKRSMTEQGSEGNITLIGSTSAVFGSYIPYGRYHDEGTQRLPKRNFSEPSERRFAIWKQQIRDDIVHHFTRNGIEVEGEIFL